MTFTFVDLFAGIGGFHAAFTGLGGTCKLACEVDPAARRVYETNWLSGLDTPFPTDVQDIATRRWNFGEYDLLVAGFPCQPFSKSGSQRGMGEARGHVFWSITEILRKTKPPVIFLENVRNLAGPRHRSDLAVMIRSLRDLGYRVSSNPTVFSPHLLPPEMGGAPQHRERVFIAGVRVGKRRAWAEAADTVVVPNRPVAGWDPKNWRIRRFLADQRDDGLINRWEWRLSEDEVKAVEVWNNLIERIRLRGEDLPGFPIWADAFRLRPQIPDGAPEWKIDFLKKNSAFYQRHSREIRSWLASSGVRELPASHRKLEWQAKDSPNLWRTVFHFRPSGIRARPLTYVPALVALAQTSVIGPERRRISPQEAATLQGLPINFDFGAQAASRSYQQLGNAVSVGAVQYVALEFLRQNLKDLPSHLQVLAQDVRQHSA